MPGCRLRGFSLFQYSSQHNIKITDSIGAKDWPDTSRMGPRRSRRSKSPGCTTPQEMYCNVTDIRGLDAENASRENLLEMNWDTSSGLPGAYMGKSNVDPLDLMSATFPGVAGPERAHAAGDLADELAELKLATGDGNVAGDVRTMCLLSLMGCLIVGRPCEQVKEGVPGRSKAQHISGVTRSERQMVFR